MIHASHQNPYRRDKSCNARSHSKLRNYVSWEKKKVKKLSDEKAMTRMVKKDRAGKEKNEKKKFQELAKEQIWFNRGL